MFEVIRKVLRNSIYIICLSFPVIVGCASPLGNDDLNSKGDNASTEVQEGREAFYLAKGKVVFVSYIDGKPEIYLMDGDGSKRQRLTENDTYEADPNWSPDGRQIIFVSANDLYNTLNIMDLDTRSTTHLIERNEFLDEPIWSPTGEWIVFGKSGELFLISPGLNQEVQLTDFGGSIWSSPLAWSADGERILFHSNYEVPGHSTSEAKLYSLNVKDRVIDPLVDKQFSYLNSADWSPNEEEIIYSIGLRNSRIFVLDLDFEIESLLLKQQHTDQFYPNWDERDAKWLPDGQHIIFSKWDGETDWEIYILDIHTDELVRLTNNSTSDSQPDWWSP